MAKKHTKSFTGIHHSLLEAIAFFKFSPNERSFIDVLWRETYGRWQQGKSSGLAKGKEMVWQPSLFIERTGMDRHRVSLIKNKLIQKRVLNHRDDGMVIWFQKDYLKWKVNCRIDVTQIGNRLLPKQVTKKDKVVTQTGNSLLPEQVTKEDEFVTQTGNKCYLNRQQVLPDQVTSVTQTGNKAGSKSTELHGENGLKERKEKKEKKDRGEAANAAPTKPDFRTPKIEIIRLYNRILFAFPGSPFNEVHDLHDRKEQQALRDRCLEDSQRQGLAWWEWYFTHITESEWLMGGDSPWTTLAHLIVQKNMSRILNGNYHKKEGPKKSGPASHQGGKRRLILTQALGNFTEYLEKKGGVSLTPGEVWEEWLKISDQDKEKYYYEA